MNGVIKKTNQSKIKENQQIADLVLALGCGLRDSYNENDLRYEKIIIILMLMLTERI